MPKTTKPKKNVKVCEPVEQVYGGSFASKHSIMWQDESNDIEVPKLRKVGGAGINGGEMKIISFKFQAGKTINWYYLLALLIGTLLVVAYSR